MNIDIKKFTFSKVFLLSTNVVIMQKVKQDFTQEDFMIFFRDDEKLNLLSADDRVEVFSQILIGSSDFTKELLDEILSDYDVSNLKIIEIENGKKLLDKRGNNRCF